MTDLGNFALLVALVASLWAIVVGFAGARTRTETATRSAEGALKGTAVALSVAAFALAHM